MAAPPAVSFAVLRAAYVLALAACGRLDFSPLTPEPDGPTGGDGPAAPCGPWDNIRHVAELSSAGDDWEPTLSGDGLTLVFTRSNPEPELWIATRDSPSGTFDVVREADELDDALAPDSESLGAMWSPDFTSIYYTYFDPLSSDFVRTADYDASTGTFGVPVAADLPSFSWDLSMNQLELFTTHYAGPTDYDVGHATRDSIGVPWQSQTTFAAANAQIAELGWPSFDDARQQLYVEAVIAGDMRIVIAERAEPGQPFSSFTPVPELAPVAGDPDVSPDGTTLVFASDGRGDGPAHEIYIATRACP